MYYLQQYSTHSILFTLYLDHMGQIAAKSEFERGEGKDKISTGSSGNPGSQSVSVHHDLDSGSQRMLE